MEQLKGKVAIVTGSTSGIGEAIAALYAELGAKVVVSGRDAARGETIVGRIAAGGGEAVFVQADLFDPGTPKKLVSAALDRWGRLDVVVNNAAIICHKPIEQVTHADWDSLFTVNLKTAFFIVQAALPHLEASKGTVINISSTNSFANCPANFVYDSLKAALNQLTRGLALDLRGRGVRVNALLPGGTDTPNLSKWLVEYAGGEKQAEAMFAQEHGAGQIADPRSIAEGAVFLADDRSSWVNGAIITIDGGMHLG